MISCGRGNSLPSRLDPSINVPTTLSACSGSPFSLNPSLGCTNPTTPSSRYGRVFTRHTPYPKASNTVTSTLAYPRTTYLVPRTSVAASTRATLHHASHSVTPRAPAMSAHWTSTGASASEVPSPSQGKRPSPRCPTSHSSAVQATGSTSISGTAGAANRIRTTNQNISPVSKPSTAIVAR